MPNKAGHRRFGNIRKRDSGRYQASYLAPDGVRRFAPNTFERKGDAQAWLSTIEADLLRGDWHDPLAGKIELGTYGEKWIAERKIGPRTRELYESLFRNHVRPFIGRRDVGELSTQLVRRWRTDLLDGGRSAITTAKAYRLLRAIMNTAVDDGLIRRNPCRIKGADQEQSAERPIATVRQVFKLAELVPARFEVLVLAAAFTGLRWGELIALRRCDVDLEAGSVRVPRRLAELDSGRLDVGPPKSAAGSGRSPCRH